MTTDPQRTSAPGTQPSAPRPPAPTRFQEIAATVYQKAADPPPSTDTPPAAPPKSGRTTEPQETGAASFYPLDTAMKPAFVARDDDLAVVLGLTGDERRAYERAFLEEVLRPSGLDGYHLGRLLYDLQVSADVADARHPGDEAALDTQVQKSSEETRRDLRATYRDQVDDLLQRADKFTRAHPKLHALLGRRGIGSRPEVVTAIVDHVRRMNFR